MPKEETPATPEVDLDDPSTWPNDIDSLTEIAKQDTGNEDIFAGERTVVAKTEEPAKEEGAQEDEPASQATPTEEKPKAAEPPTETPAEPVKPKEGEATEEDLDKLTADTAVVQTPDGKHQIPFNVLRDTRTRAQELEEENQRLREQLAAPKSGEGTPATEPGQTGAAADEVPKPKTLADMQLNEAQTKEVEEVRAEYGDKMAELHEKQLRTNLLMEEVQADNIALQQRLEREDAMVVQDETAVIQQAMDSSPQMLAWQTGSDPADAEMYENAVELHKQLVTRNPEYAAMSWEDRFAALPAKVMALYGERGTLAQQTTPQTGTEPKPKTDQDKVKAKAEKELARAQQDTTPVTISDMPAGEIPVADEITHSLESKTPGEVQAYFNRLAKDPNKFRSFLDEIA